MTNHLDLEFRQTPNRLVLWANQTLALGEITWELAADVMTINHTFVQPEYRGQGIAEELVAEAVEIARENNYRVVPLCPFAKKEFERKIEYQDLL
ncbi:MULTISPECIES: GNAT family N-acetyltransferase [unclassified Enterococcus]|uniref:GNAT family N-acetyltransferase n=1 Tax=unclassified Enterococcus TaxID=2608891 RepID=UPI00155299D0|nr:MULTISPECIES: GNAT family N-acetyltransferase [unclassified Enterococcus]MBS7577181.1 N-acetyltransferase [Enterococcus sp. MMGLQ5-2]MBS7584726.1 N-acetyltransferase [Enterococcus sp. MMGLQ5-1]NPD12581.1 N-acetyltransferase [Enterococcus sp. MMGLQ5-1]NPD37015.1 N-acetyltransferase [Enterococcus sp. MMGLQ5-2]